MKRNQKKNQRPETPSLKFTASAWAKLLYLRDYGPTEVGGFGICPNHPLLVEDIRLVNQSCTYTTVSFDDESVADFFEDQVAEGLTPEQFARVWIHTHPGSSAEPSFTDEETFTRVFRQSNWAVMAILACGGESYARLRLNGDHKLDLLAEVEVVFDQEFAGTQFEQWEDEYLSNVVECDGFAYEPWDWTKDDLLNPSLGSYDQTEDYDTYFEEDQLNDQFEHYARIED